MADKKVPHLKDLFKTGEMLTLPVLNPKNLEETVDIQIWIRKPTTSQHDEALTKGRAASARRRNQYRDKSSDLYISLIEQVNDLTTKEELIDKLLSYEDSKLRQQAYNEVLFVESDDDEEEPRWGHDGRNYIDLLGAIRERYQEIQRFNAEFTADEDHLRIKLENDEELKRLNAEQEEFQAEVEERFSVIRAREAAKLGAKSEQDLRLALQKQLMELDVGMAFYQEYKSRLLYFSCRDPENKEKFYWSSPEDIWDQPQFVQQAIINAVDALEVGADELKNSLSLLSS